jgi:hypothetical protein
VPQRNLSRCTARQSPGAGEPTHQQKVKIILAQRERLIADIAALRRLGASSKFVDNAQQLLTRWWATANWNGREELLRTADWLVRLEHRRALATPRTT